MKLNNTLIDTITNYGITIRDDELYLVKNGVVIKFVDNELYLNNNNNKRSN